MKEYIERKALVAEFERLGLGENSLIERVFADGVYAVIECAPAADVAPVVHGRWYWAEDGHCKCSVCGQYATVKRLVVKTNYCPNCGARMDGE